MKILGRLLALGLAGLGLLFLVAAGEGNAPARIAIGVVLLGSAGAMVALSRLRPQQITHRMQLDLPGDTSVEPLRCQECGGAIDRGSIHVVAGAVFARCDYCGVEVQLEEEPKW